MATCDPDLKRDFYFVKKYYNNDRLMFKHILIIIGMAVFLIIFYLSGKHSAAPVLSPTQSPILSSALSSDFQQNKDIPIANAKSRITKKTFGLFVSPQNSPVLPEKFTGYHTGVDFETFLGDENTDINV